MSNGLEYVRNIFFFAVVKQKRQCGSKLQNREMYVQPSVQINTFFLALNPLNAELNPICHLLALLGAHHILHVSRIKFKDLGKLPWLI
jgi:hypothetical protein